MWDRHKKTGCWQRLVPSTECTHLRVRCWKCSPLALPWSVWSCCFISINTLDFSIFPSLNRWLLAVMIAWGFPYTTNIFSHLTPNWRHVPGSFCLIHNWKGNVFNSFAVNILCRHPRGESLHPCPLANHLLNRSEQLFLGCPWGSRTFCRQGGLLLEASGEYPCSPHSPIPRSRGAFPHSSGRTAFGTRVVRFVRWPRTQESKCADWMNLELECKEWLVSCYCVVFWAVCP